MKLSDKVAAKIQEDIRLQKYRKGEKIPSEPELMKTYGVGRSSIREAIKSLAIAGILSVQQGSGTFVSQELPQEQLQQRLIRADFEEINAVRRLLEEELVKLAADRATSEDLEAIEKHLEQRRKAILEEDLQACTNADIAFHLQIASASHNTVLADLYRSFTATMRQFFLKREVKGIGHFAISHHLHQALFAAIQHKKKKQAITLIKDILDNNY